jgi:hypothetical protein
MKRASTERSRERFRVIAAVGAALLCLAAAPMTASAEPSGTPSPGPSGGTQPQNPPKSPVTVSLVSMTPRAPDARKLDQPIAFVATLSNDSDTRYSAVRVYLERGAPLTTQASLDQSIASAGPTDTIVPSYLDVNRPLLPHASLTVTYKTSPQSDRSGGMCLCQTAVYPYALVAQGVVEGGTYTEVGRTPVLVASFPDKEAQPQPVAVNWVWPLIERPHRTVSETVFNDDQLAGSVSAHGRLWRVLQVAEKLQGKVRLTIPIDPDLIDSLAVMASPTGYEVRTGSSTVKGTGGPAARDWLTALASIKAKHDIVLTAYGDPDINAVTRAGLAWSTALDPQVKARLSPTIDDFTSDLIWPADGVLTTMALDTAVASGASAILLSDSVLPGQNKTEPRPDGLSPLPTATGVATALVTDSTLQQIVSRAMKLSATPAGDQQQLLAQLAIRAVQDPTVGHFAVLAADRYVDPNPDTAVATILATSTATWSESIGRRAAMTSFKSVDRGSLQILGGAADNEASAAAMSSLLQTQSQVTSLRAALDNDSALDLLGGFKLGIQRAESNAWRADHAIGDRRAAELSARIDALTAKVHLVEPATRNYSLSSSNSPIVVTIVNELTRPVKVRVSVTGGRGAVGFTADPVDVQTIPAGSLQKISVTTHVNRVNRFKVIAELATPDGGQLGPTLELNVRSTALGGITKTVTFVAAGVLIAALLLRLIRRIGRGYSTHPATTVGGGW